MSNTIRILYCKTETSQNTINIMTFNLPVVSLIIPVLTASFNAHSTFEKKHKQAKKDAAGFRWTRQNSSKSLLYCILLMLYYHQESPRLLSTVQQSKSKLQRDWQVDWTFPDLFLSFWQDLHSLMYIHICSVLMSSLSFTIYLMNYKWELSKDTFSHAILLTTLHLRDMN
jgi:hypothetical protein